jgi:putative IMPACT (imprinted ancient) family translation regulator
VAVVTRYFGGVKLGVRGLIEAYGESVQAAVDAAALKKLVNYATYTLQVGYDMAETVKYQAQQLQGEITDTAYAVEVTMQMRVEAHRKDALDGYLQEMAAAGKLTLLEQ